MRLQLAIPAVVEGEILFQHVSSGKKRLEKVNEHIAELSLITATEHRQKLSADLLEKQVRTKFDKWKRTRNASVLPIPVEKIDWSELCRKAIWRIPPFVGDPKNPNNEKGFRDALILETVAAFVIGETGKINIAFISNDNELRQAVAATLRNQARFSAHESLAALSSYIKLTRELLTNEFISVIVQRAANKFYDDHDSHCLWQKAELFDKLLAIQDAWSIQNPSLNLATFDVLGKSSGSVKLSSLGEVRFTGQNPLPWKGTSRIQMMIGPHEFQKTSGKRTYHWKSTIDYYRVWAPSEAPTGPPVEMVQFVRFAANWKADVNSDARFQNMALEEIKLDRKEFRQLTTEDKQKYVLLNPAPEPIPSIES